MWKIKFPNYFSFFFFFVFGVLSLSLCVIGGHYQWRAPPSKKKTHGRLLCVCVCVCLWRLEKQIFSFLSTKRVQENVCVCRLFFFYRSTCQCVVRGSKYPRSACHSRYSSCVNVGSVSCQSRHFSIVSLKKKKKNLFTFSCLSTL